MGIREYLLIAICLILYFNLSVIRVQFSPTESVTNPPAVKSLSVPIGSFPVILERLKKMAVSGTVIISFFDSLIWQEFLYFYIHSIKANKITNFMAFSYDKPGVTLCLENNFECDLCFTNRTVKSINDNTYQSTGFLERMFIRNEVIWELLKAGMGLIVTDVDILYLKNPVDYIITGTHDIATSRNKKTGELNGGFFFLRNTPNALRLFERIMSLHPEFPKDNDQDLLNRAVKEAKSYADIKKLPYKQFWNGLEFFEFQHIFFAEQFECQDCYTIHNNWMLGFEAKEYRLKELHLYKFDYDGYYSSDNNYYLSLDYDEQERTLENDKMTLMLGLYLANISNRIVILPRFKCYDVKRKSTPICSSPDTECNFLVHWNIKRFNSVFKTKYRESTFLTHPFTSKTVKNDIVPLLIDNSKEMTKLDNDHKVYKVHFSKLSLETVPQEFVTTLEYSLWKDNYRQMTHMKKVN